MSKVPGTGKGETGSAQAAFARNRPKEGGDGFSTSALRTQSRKTRSETPPKGRNLGAAMAASGGHKPESRSLPAKSRPLPKASTGGSAKPKAGSFSPPGKGYKAG